ncbi:hypothetical protein ACFVJK_30490 [Streptomyces sp. NPDC127172]|uniref:hypothetical protein n=1 Tax=Streptomyces sp. NPDC127172 TaxID=3345382 RepID=UPI00362783B4
MRSTVDLVTDTWEVAFKLQQEAAVAGAMTAFPLLQRMPYPTGCCDLRMNWEQDGLGEGHVCVDDQGRGTVEFIGMPQAAVGAALDTLMGKGWWDDAPDGIEAAGPGDYFWSDEDHGGEWEIKVEADGRLTMSMDFMRIPDVIGVLDTVHTALTAT